MLVQESYCKWNLNVFAIKCNKILKIFNVCFILNKLSEKTNEIVLNIIQNK